MFEVLGAAELQKKALNLFRNPGPLSSRVVRQQLRRIFGPTRKVGKKVSEGKLPRIHTFYYGRRKKSGKCKFLNNVGIRVSSTDGSVTWEELRHY